VKHTLILLCTLAVLPSAAAAQQAGAARKVVPDSTRRIEAIRLKQASSKSLSSDSRARAEQIQAAIALYMGVADSSVNQTRAGRLSRRGAPPR
jgi:hypothetical protein